MKRSSSRHRIALAIAACLATLGALPAAGSTWQVARGPSAIGFRVSHLIFTEVEGRFTRFSGSVDLPGGDLQAARIRAEIDAASIRTGHKDRDKHLKSAEFLAAETYPKLHFVSREVRHAGADRYEIVGDLTIRDVTREIVLAARSMGRKQTPRGVRLDFVASGTLDRDDYGLRWNTLWDGKLLLGDQVEIYLEICLVEDPLPGPPAPARDQARAPLTPSPNRR